MKKGGGMEKSDSNGEGKGEKGGVSEGWVGFVFLGDTKECERAPKKGNTKGRANKGKRVVQLKKKLGGKGH